MSILTDQPLENLSYKEFLKHLEIGLNNEYAYMESDYYYKPRFIFSEDNIICYIIIGDHNFMLTFDNKSNIESAYNEYINQNSHMSFINLNLTVSKSVYKEMAVVKPTLSRIMQFITYKIDYFINVIDTYDKYGVYASLMYFIFTYIDIYDDIVLEVNNKYKLISAEIMDNNIVKLLFKVKPQKDLAKILLYQVDVKYIISPTIDNIQMDSDEMCIEYIEYTIYSVTNTGTINTEEIEAGV